MFKRRGLWTLVGFALFFMGFLSIILGMIGIQFSFLKWLDFFGRGFGFLVRLFMILTGIIFIVLAQSKDED